MGAIARIIRGLSRGGVNSAHPTASSRAGKGESRAGKGEVNADILAPRGRYFDATGVAMNTVRASSGVIGGNSDAGRSDSA